MYNRLLVPLDGSSFATEALPLGRLLADRLGASLHLVHVIPPTLGIGLAAVGDEVAAREGVRASVGGYLQEKAAEVTGAAGAPTTAVLEGSIVPELHGYIEREGIDLVVLTSHGSGGIERIWRGSVADGLLHAGGTDLLMVQPWDDTEGGLATGADRFSKILVPLDGSPYAEAALERAAGLADRFGATLILVQVVPRPIELTSIYGVPGVEVAGIGHMQRIVAAEQYLASVATRLGERDCETHVVATPGAAEGIVEAARDLGADLIVLAGHGRIGVERVVMGSVSDQVMRGTTRPVLVVRPPLE